MTRREMQQLRAMNGGQLRMIEETLQQQRALEARRGALMDVTQQQALEARRGAVADFAGRPKTPLRDRSQIIPFPSRE